MFGFDALSDYMIKCFVDHWINSQRGLLGLNPSGTYRFSPYGRTILWLEYHVIHPLTTTESEQPIFHANDPSFGANNCREHTDASLRITRYGVLQPLGSKLPTNHVPMYIPLFTDVVVKGNIKYVLKRNKLYPNLERNSGTKPKRPPLE